MEGMKEVILKTPLYLVEIKLIIYNDESKINHDSKEYQYKDRIGCVYLKDGFIILILNNYHNLTNGEIAHEAKHAVNEILLHIGASLDLNNDEHECYLLQWLIDEIDNYLNQ